MMFQSQVQYDNFHAKLEKLKKQYQEKKITPQQTYDELIKRKYTNIPASRLIERWRTGTISKKPVYKKPTEHWEYKDKPKEQDF